MKKHLWSAIVSALSLAGVVGCNQCGHQPLFPNAPWNKGCGCAKATHPGPGPVGLSPGQPVAVGPEAAGPLPPGSTFTPPAGSAVAPAPGGSATFGPGPGISAPSAPAPSQPVEIRGYGPVSDSTWHAPANGGVRLAIPESAPSRDTVRLNQPEIPSGAPKPIVSESKNSEPPRLPLQSDIAQFTYAYDQVASGLRPSGTSGLEWLKANNFRAVLYLRRPIDDETSDRRETESRGLKYLSLEVQPQSLRESLDQFKTIVTDSANYPVFVYSKDSMITGSLWYLQFRTVNGMTESEARIKATRLGLQEEQTDANRPMWLAIQKALEPIR